MKARDIGPGFDWLGPVSIMSFYVRPTLTVRTDNIDRISIISGVDLVTGWRTRKRVRLIEEVQYILRTYGSQVCPFFLLSAFDY